MYVAVSLGIAIAHFSLICCVVIILNGILQNFHLLIRTEK